MFWINDSPKDNIIAILQRPSELRCFQAIINLSTPSRRLLSVVLPGPDPESDSIYQRWKLAIEKGEVDNQNNVDLIFYSSAYLTDSGYKYMPERIWKNLMTFE